MTEQYQESQQTALVPMSVQQLLRVVLVGVLVGALTWGVTFLLDTYVFKGMLCQANNSAQCGSSLSYAGIAASLLVAGLGLLALAKLQVFRALLVVITATISLWGLHVMLDSWPWHAALLISILLFAVSYSLFAWVARIRSFLLAVIVMVIVIVGVRLVLNS